MNHKLIQANEYSTGATEWICPDCDYRVIFDRRHVNHVTLNQGDVGTVHTCEMQPETVRIAFGVGPTEERTP